MRSLHHPIKLPYPYKLTSRLIGLQIKRVMYNLALETTGYILEKLEKCMLAGKLSGGTAWATSFCVISILCMCAEMVQIATDLKIVHIMKEEKGYTEISREDRISHKRGEALFDCQKKFHFVFKTHKRNGNQKNERGFNPLKHGLDIYSERGLNKTTENLIDNVRRAMTERGNCHSHSYMKQAKD